MIDYTNVPRTIAIVMSHQSASLHDLQTIYSLEDVYDMIEVIMVDNHNESVLSKEARNG